MDDAKEQTSDSSIDVDSEFQWSAVAVVQAIAVFVASGLAEIGGGWLIWKAVRSNKPWWWAILGGVALIVYGFLPTLQPSDSFGRIYAVYGGFFIVLSLVWGWILDGDRPDTGDIVGGAVIFCGASILLFWPR